MSPVKCHPCTSETPHTCAECPCGVGGNLLLGEARGGAVQQRVAAALSCACECCQGFVPCFILENHSWALNGTSKVQHELIEHSEAMGIWEKRIQGYPLEHSWAPAIIFFSIPKFLMWIHFSFGIFSIHWKNAQSAVCGGVSRRYSQKQGRLLLGVTSSWNNYLLLAQQKSHPNLFIFQMFVAAASFAPASGFRAMKTERLIQLRTSQTIDR